jgi:hypothetical protein
VVVAGLVTRPSTTRSWALPVLAARYRPPEWERVHGTRHQTPAPSSRRRWARVRRWLPERRVLFGGDPGDGPSETARCGPRHRQPLTVVRTCAGAAAVYAPPPPRPRKTRGRPRVKGHTLASPQEVVATPATHTSLTVAWSGGTTSALEGVPDTGHWSRLGDALVAVRWVSVHAATGPPREESWCTTARERPAPQLVEGATPRWSIATPVQEGREDLQRESTTCDGQATV